MRCRPATRATPMLNSSSIRLRRRESVSLGRFQNCNLLEMDHFRRHGVEDELGSVENCGKRSLTVAAPIGGVSGTWKSLPAGMLPRGHTARVLILACLACAALDAQVAITGRVVDENGAAVDGARVEWRAVDGGIVTVSSDPAGNFRTSLPAAGEYAVRAERLGFFVFTDSRQAF